MAGWAMDYGVIAIVAICVLVLVIGALKQKSRVLFQFVARVMLGFVGIYFFNKFLKIQAVPVAAGLNPVNLLTLGTLGISGFALVYGILFYKFL